jgi:stage IV sporulation protein FB
MVHELGHVVTGRIFGQPGNITVTGLGGQAVGEYGELRPWQRILVIFAGPGAGFAFVALIVAFDAKYWNFAMDWDWINCPNLKVRLNWIDHIDPLLRMGSSATYDLALPILFFINLFVNIMNLLPIIPMDGGMIFKEVCCLIAPKAGLKFAFIWSFVLAVGVTLYMLLVVLKEFNWIPQTVPVYYPFVYPVISLIVFGMMAYQSWKSYRQLAAMERHSLYAQDD